MSGCPYQISGTFIEGKPEIEANKYLIDILAPAAPEEDPKAKKDPKKAVEET